ncbi:MAG: guanylate kinase [Clostridiaceae bacterium]|nr:guanylate kinase [Clostridiaceae bacterium]
MSREGLLVVVSGPSGAGKGTVINLLKQKDDNVKLSVSATTRQPRIGEIEGVNYFFKTHDQFNDMIKGNQLVEWVKYCDNFYGTPKKYIQDTVEKGYDCILEIEVEGALNIKENYPDCVSIFILPPSFKELKRRIEGRGTEQSDVICKRLEKARKEIEFADRYDYVIVNDSVENAVVGISNILAAEKLKFTRNKGILKTLES